MTTTDAVRALIPYPDSVTVSVHPDADGDVVSEAFVDMNTGERFIVLRTPQGAHSVGARLVFATTDEDIGEQADQLRGSTGHTDGSNA